MEMDIHIRANEYALIHRTNSDWWLDVKWGFQNSANQTYYVLAEGFLSISMGDFLLIDHTTESKSYLNDANIDPVLKFRTLKGKSSIVLQNRYPLPHIKAFESTNINVIGKFSVSSAEPDSAWLTSCNWELIKVWENILFSSEFKIKG